MKLVKTPSAFSEQGFSETTTTHRSPPVQSNTQFNTAQEYGGHEYTIDADGYYWHRPLNASYNLFVSNSLENMRRAIDVLNERGFYQ